MLTTEQLKDYAGLCGASYASFDLADFAGYGGDAKSLLPNLQADGKGDFTDAEAKGLSSRYGWFSSASEVLSGVSASFFRAKEGVV